MNRGRVIGRVIPLLIAIALLPSACADRRHGDGRSYYDRWGLWQEFGGFDDDPHHSHFHYDGRHYDGRHYDGRRDGFASHAGYVGHDSWHGGWGHGIAGHAGHGDRGPG